jgi:hypothetical protein
MRASYVHLALIALLTLCALTAKSAHADSPQALLRKGNSLFAAGDYVGAFAAFEQGYEQSKSPTPVFLRSMAFCLLKMYRHEEAKQLLREYLKKYPKAADRTRIDNTLKELEIVVATKLSITTTPAGAEVYIDTLASNMRGKTPYEGTIKPGEHTVFLRLDGYQTATKLITVKPRATVKLDLPLLIPVRIDSKPPGATIRVGAPDRPARGKTPATIGMRPGAHTVYLALDGFKSFSAPITASASKEVTLAAELRVGLNIQTTPSGAAVLLDGQAQPGVTPVEVEATPGQHKLEIALAGFNRVSRVVQFKRGQSQPLALELTGGLLSMRTDTPGARVKVGRLEIGTTPLERASVPAGPQQVVIEHPERRSWHQAIAFSADEVVAAKVKLGRRSWPFWTMAAASAGALIAGIATFVVASSKTNELNTTKVYDRDPSDAGVVQVGTGICSNGSSVKRYDIGPESVKATELFDRNGNLLGYTDDDCSYQMHHMTTALFSIGATGAIGSLLYYLFFMRPEAQIERHPRGEAISAEAADLRL